MTSTTTTTKTTTYYRLHLEPLARTISCRHRPLDDLMPFRLHYRAPESHLTISFQTLSDYSDFYTRTTYDIRLGARHYAHVQPHQRFRTLHINDDPDEVPNSTGIRTVRVPLLHVRQMTIRVYRRQTVHCRLDARHPLSTAPHHSALVDWHPAQVLAVVPVNQLNAFEVPAFGQQPTGLRVLRDEVSGTVCFALCMPHDVKYAARTTSLCIECTDRPERSTGWMSFGCKYPLDRNMRELLCGAGSAGDAMAISGSSRFVLAVSAMEVRSTPDLELTASSCAYLVQYAELLNDELHAASKDLRLLIGNKRQPMMVIRVLLCSQSPVIMSMLELQANQWQTPGLMITLDLPNDHPDLWRMWWLFTCTGHVQDGPHLMYLLMMATKYGMMRFQHAVAMTMVRCIDFVGQPDWRKSVEKVLTLYPCEALNKLLNSRSAETAVHRCARMMDTAQSYGAASHLSLRNVFRDAMLFEDVIEPMASVRPFLLDNRYFRLHRFVLDVMAPHFEKGLEALFNRRLECTSAEMDLMVRHIYCGDLLVVGVDDPARIWVLAMHFGLERLQYEAESCAMAQLHANPCLRKLAEQLTQMSGAMRLLSFAKNMVDMRAGVQMATVKQRHAIEVANRLEYLSEDSDWEE